MHERFEQMLSAVRESGCLAGKGYECAIERDVFRFSVKNHNGKIITSVRFGALDDLTPLVKELMRRVRLYDRQRLNSIVTQQKKGLTFRPAIGGFRDVTGASAPMRTRRNECQ
jgi:hypothetical protein